MLSTGNSFPSNLLAAFLFYLVKYSYDDNIYPFRVTNLHHCFGAGCPRLTTSFLGVNFLIVISPLVLLIVLLFVTSLNETCVCCFFD